VITLYRALRAALTTGIIHILINPGSSEPLSQLLLVVLHDSIALLLLVFVLAHHRIYNHLPSVGRNEEVKRHVLLLFRNQFTVSQGLEELVDGASACLHAAYCAGGLLFMISRCIFRFFGGLASTLNDIKKFFKFDLLRAVSVDSLNELLNLRPIFHQTKSDQRVLELVNTDGLGTIIVKRIKTIPELVELAVRKVNIVRLAMVLQPFPPHALGVKNQI